MRDAATRLADLRARAALRRSTAGLSDPYRGPSDDDLEFMRAAQFRTAVWLGDDS